MVRSNGHLHHLLHALLLFHHISTPSVALSCNDGSSAFCVLAHPTSCEGKLHEMIVREGSLNPVDGIDISFFASPAFKDMDNDGDLDVFVELEQWERSGGLKDYWENIGSPKSPAFAERSGGVSLLSFPEKPFDRMGSCTFADLNGDMHEEVYCGGSNGEKNGGENGVNIPNCCGAKTNAQGAPKIFKMAVPEMVGGVFSRSTSVENPFLDDTSGKYLYSTPINGMETTLKEYLDSSMVSFFDMDADGDLDLLCGQGFLNEEPTNNYQYFENEGSATSPIFTPRSKADSPFHALPSRYNGYPNGDDDNPTGLDGPRYGGGNGVIVDLDGDGTFAVVFYFLLLFVLSFDIFLTNLHHFTRFYFSLNL